MISLDDIYDQVDKILYELAELNNMLPGEFDRTMQRITKFVEKELEEMMQDLSLRWDAFMDEWERDEREDRLYERYRELP